MKIELESKDKDQSDVISQYTVETGLYDCINDIMLEQYVQVKQSEKSVNHRALMMLLVAHYKFQIHGGLPDDAIQFSILSRPSKSEDSEVHILGS